MDKIAALVSLNEAKKTIEELTDRIKSGFVTDKDETDTRKILIVLLSVLGALALIGVIAYLVYRHFSDDYIDDYDDIDDILDEEEPEVISSDDDD